ncbi:MAG: hypothetical protein Q9162_002093 [Coniocarpon cinnabarinum]
MSSESTFSFQYVYKDEVITLGSLLPAACIIVVALRFYTRHIQKALIGVDDWLALCGLIPVAGMGACLIADVLLKIAIATIVLWTITFELLIIFDCRGHISSNWASSGEEAANCPVGFTSEYGLAISDLILDVFIFLIPLPLVSLLSPDQSRTILISLSKTLRLQLSIKCKFAVCGIFLLGASAVGASVARLILYVQVLKAATTNTVVDPNRK